MKDQEKEVTEQSRFSGKAVVVILFFIIFVVTFYYLIGQDKTELPSQLIDRKAPNFQVKDLIDPSVIHTQEIFLGEITLLNVWATWCPSCYVEHPFWEQHAKNKDVVIAGLNYRDDRQKALQFLDTRGNFYQWNLFDEKGRLGIDFGVYGAPETFVIGPKGKVRYRYVGVVTPEVFQSIFLPLIESIKLEVN
jgi:cytochrome c biogenesis protein CcmG/thiol:disulfide interchange protein DsbE